MARQGPPGTLLHRLATTLLAVVAACDAVPQRFDALPTPVGSAVLVSRGLQDQPGPWSCVDAAHDAYLREWAVVIAGDAAAVGERIRALNNPLEGGTSPGTAGNWMSDLQAVQGFSRRHASTLRRLESLDEELLSAWSVCLGPAWTERIDAQRGHAGAADLRRHELPLAADRAHRGERVEVARREAQVADRRHHAPVLNEEEAVPGHPRHDRPERVDRVRVVETRDEKAAPDPREQVGVRGVPGGQDDGEKARVAHALRSYRLTREGGGAGEPGHVIRRGCLNSGIETSRTP